MTEAASGIVQSLPTPPAYPRSLLPKTKQVAAAVFLALQAIALPAAYADGSITEFVQLDESKGIWSVKSGEGLYIEGDNTLYDFEISVGVENPGKWIFADGSTLFLDHFMESNETSMGLYVTDGAKLEMSGSGTFKAYAGTNYTANINQRGSAIWVCPATSSKDTSLTITGTSVEVQGDKGVRVDGGASFVLDNTSNPSGHLYVGIDSSDGTLKTVNAEMQNGLVTVNGGASISIKTNTAKFYSVGSTMDYTSVIGTSKDSSEGTTTLKKLGAKGYSSISVEAKDFEIQAFGGDTIGNAFVVNASANKYNGAEIHLSGGDFKLDTDWYAAIGAYSDKVNTGKEYGVITMDFDTVTLNSSKNSVIAYNYEGSYDDAAVHINAKSVTIESPTTSTYTLQSWYNAAIDITAENDLTIASHYLTSYAKGSNARISLQSGKLSVSDDNNYAAWATKGALISYNADSENSTYAAGNTTLLSGDLRADYAGVVKVGLGTADSVFNGGGYDYNFTGSSACGYISIYAANGATWNVELWDGKYSSTIYEYVSTDKNADGISSYVNLTGVGTGQKLRLSKLSGSGAEFILRTQVDENRTGYYRDHVQILSGTGDHYILVKAMGIEDPEVPDWTAEVQSDYLIQHYEEDGATSVRLDTAASDASGEAGEAAAQSEGAVPLSFVLANKNQAVDIGNRRYVLMTRDIADDSGTGTEWYLQYAGAVPEEPKETDPEPGTFIEEPDPEPEPEPDPVVPDTPVPDQNFENLSSSAQLVTTLAGYGNMYSAWTANLTDLRKRLGEVRYGAQDGLWARAIWQKDTTDGITGGKFEQKLKGIQIGVDHIVTQDEDRMWLVGGNFKYADADQKVRRMTYGRGDMTTYGAFLYATYANYKGCYADFVLSLDHYKEKLTAQQSDWTMTHGRYNTWGWGASAEIGKMFSSTQNDEGWGPWYANWWIEPQLQLAYYWGKGKNFTMDNGMTVSQENGQSLIGRAGVVIGKKFNYGKNRKEVDKRYSQFYVKGGVKQEFLGDQKLTVNGERFSGNLRGPRVYYGAGFDWNATDQLRLYAQVEREQGSKYKRDYQVSVGLRWQF
jgi:outer membrane autotransporter protein